jgi:hypothetical protein
MLIVNIENVLHCLSDRLLSFSQLQQIIGNEYSIQYELLFNSEKKKRGYNSINEMC